MCLLQRGKLGRMAGQTHTYITWTGCHYNTKMIIIMQGEHSLLASVCTTANFFFLWNIALDIESSQILLPYSRAQEAAEADFHVITLYLYVVCICRSPWAQLHPFEVHTCTRYVQLKYYKICNSDTIYEVLQKWTSNMESFSEHSVTFMYATHRHKYNTFKLPLMHLNGTVN